MRKLSFNVKRDLPERTWTYLLLYKELFSCWNEFTWNCWKEHFKLTRSPLFPHLYTLQVLCSWWNSLYSSLLFVCYYYFTIIQHISFVHVQLFSHNNNILQTLLFNHGLTTKHRQAKLLNFHFTFDTCNDYFACRVSVCISSALNYFNIVNSVSTRFIIIHRKSMVVVIVICTKWK